MGDFGLPAAKTVEAHIHGIGQQHLDNDQVDAAIAVFRLNADTFPSSTKSWNALAEALVVKGDEGAALLYFRRSLLIDPHNTKAMRMVAALTPAIG